MIALVVPPLFTGTLDKGSNKAPAISNLKQIGLALFDFENDYGSYPDSETAKDVTDAFPNHGHDLSGNSSNALFRQLIATGMIPDEEFFYTESRNSRKPDGNIAPGEALKKGEVGFAYISGQASAGNPSRILLLSPLIPGTTKFDPKPYDGNAIALHIDQSASVYKIGKDGHIYDKNGLDILSPEHPRWNGKAPTIHYPE
ncbi:MAG: hypothetical protein V4727_03940 [Verrucomicrobiota bacterium]